MQPTRRDVIRVGLGGLGIVSLAGSVPSFLSQFAFAQTNSGSSVSNDNILVVVQLSGGKNAEESDRISELVRRGQENDGARQQLALELLGQSGGVVGKLSVGQ